MQSLSLQFLPLSHASLVSTTPLSVVATGDGCDHLQNALVHFMPNLHSVGDCGRSGGTKARRCCVVDVATVGGVGLAGVANVGMGATTGAGGAAATEELLVAEPLM
jgi:hypothetical protein